MRGTAPQSVADALAQPLDWSRVLQLVTQHRVLPALHTAVRSRTDLPASIRSAIASRFAAHQRRVLRFSAELSGILECFDRQRIEVICIKGLVLAQQLYGDPALREFGDLDFLIRPSDVPRARLALRDLGYEPELKLTDAQERRYLRIAYEYGFGTAEQKHLVEMQWQIVPSFYAIDFDMDRMFASSVDSDLHGRAVRVLCPEDLLLALCVHAAKHQWNQLGMIRDIATLAASSLEWRTVFVQAQHLRIQRILIISLLLARDLLRLSLPPRLESHPDLAEASWLTSHIAWRMAHDETSPPESLAYFRLVMKLRESRRDRFRMAWRLASTPNVGEWETMALPEGLRFLYAGIRMARLAKRFSTSAVE